MTRLAHHRLDGISPAPEPISEPASAAWPKVSGNAEEARRLAAALASAGRPNDDLPWGDIPEYIVTHQVENGISEWSVTTDGPEPKIGIHRCAWDADHTSLARDPLALAFKLLESFD